jgi:hypothetical protein
MKNNVTKLDLSTLIGFGAWQCVLTKQILTKDETIESRLENLLLKRACEI